MLGENYSFLNDFPEFKDTIAELMIDATQFSKDAHRYDQRTASSLAIKMILGAFSYRRLCH